MRYIGAFINPMADNTRMKEFATELRRQAEALEKSEAVNKTRFDRLEAMQKTSDTRFNQFVEAVEKFMQQSTPVTHGCTNSGSISTFVGHTNAVGHSSVSMSLTPFQVRHIKLEFPRFNIGKKVLDWIFKAEQFFGYYNTLDP